MVEGSDTSVQGAEQETPPAAIPISQSAPPPSSPPPPPPEASPPPPPSPPPSRPHDKEMSFVGHLAELRNRILISLASWVTCAIGTWFLTPTLIEWLRRPLGNRKLIFTHPTEAFMVYLKVAVLGGLFIALPFIGYQIAAFVAPGLEPHEKKWLKRLVPASFLLFLGGAAFAYFAVLPFALHFFLSFENGGLESMWRIEEYVGFNTMMLIVCGLVFQTPIVILVLAMLGIVNAKMLAAGRRWAIVVIFIIAGIVTPTPDAFTQCVVAVPMIVLYELSIWIVRAAVKPPVPEPEPAPEGTSDDA